VDFSGPSITPITVGENPMGIDVTAAEDYAFVVNRADNGFSSVSKINLMDLRVVTQEGAGLKPTHIGLLDEFGLAAILSSVDNSVTVIDINF
jgi:DNA-binding beta-propeller fold protein YncE